MITTKYGKIRGIEHEDYREYRGVPYARPPVGELRWRAPQEPEAWDGVLDATAWPAKCAQWGSEGRELMPGEIDYHKEFYQDPAYAREISEDCLYLQIWTPKDAEEGDTAYPVALWIHGGGFIGGYSSEVEFDGAAYARRGVILVSVEYRCNIFGFLAHPWLTEEDPLHVSGNYGIRDQIAALAWIRENIASFGGDPGNVTVFGQSAGAMSTQILVSSDLTDGLIHKAIMQSGGTYGSGLAIDYPLALQEQTGAAFAEEVGAGSLEELRAMSTEELMKAAGLYSMKLYQQGKGLFWIPTIDGVIMKDGCYAMMDQRQIKDIPYIVGSTKDDIADPEALRRGVLAFGDKLSELEMTAPYLYLFSHALPGDDCGAFHSAELWYMFGTLGRCWRPMGEEDTRLSEEMLDYWTNFMKTGDPNGEGLASWEAYTPGGGAVKTFA